MLAFLLIRKNSKGVKVFSVAQLPFKSAEKMNITDIICNFAKMIIVEQVLYYEEDYFVCCRSCNACCILSGES